MSDYKPPFHMTDKMTSLIAEISEQVGRITVLQEGTINPHLRRENRIRTIHSSLAIEHNSLSLEQVTAILDGKRILGNPNEIKEVQNAYEAYELMLRINPASVDDLLEAHKLMMITSLNSSIPLHTATAAWGGYGTASCSAIRLLLPLTYHIKLGFY